MLQDYSLYDLPPPVDLLDAASRGEYDVVRRMMDGAGKDMRQKALDIATTNKHHETVAMLQKTMVALISVPESIDEELSTNLHVSMNTSLRCSLAVHK